MKKQNFFPIIIILALLIINACSKVNNIQGSFIADNQNNMNFNGSYKIGVMLALTGDAATNGLPEQAVIKIVNQNLKSLAAEKMGYSTSEVGDLVVKNLL